MEMEMETTLQQANKPDISLLDDLLEQGLTEEDILIALRQKNHARFVSRQEALPLKPLLDADGWTEHKAWHLDPQPVYGELKDFYIAGRVAMEGDDQVGFSRQKDLLFKAVGTFLAQEWQKHVAAEAERIMAEAATAEG